MKWIILFFLQFLLFVYAQVLTPVAGSNTMSEEERRYIDSIDARNQSNKPADSLKIYNPKIGDYNYWTAHLSKRTVDTVLNVDSFYKQNVYQRDLFAYQQFPNLGQTLQPLELEPSNQSLELLPMGKSFMYIQEEDVKYYDVKTPLTEFILENGVKEGQYLSTTFAHNIHSRWNNAINYRYLKSQGRYLNSLVKHANIVVSSNYRTKNNRYQIQGNFVSQDLNNQENAGLTAESLQDFITDNPNFSNRERMYINLSDAQSKYDERRIYFEHRFGLLSLGKKQDSLAVPDTLQQKTYPIYIQHSLSYKHQAYEYDESSDQSYFPSEVISTDRRNRKKLNKLENRLSLGYQWSEKLDIEAGILHQSIDLYYDNPLSVGAITIPASTQDNRFGLQAKVQFDWRQNIHITADAAYTKGDQLGDAYHLNAKARIIPFKNYLLQGGFSLNSNFPSLNLLSNQSFYTDYNYYNPQFKNETSQELYAELTSQQLGLTVYGGVINQNNLVYLSSDYTPQQTNDALNYFKIGAREHYKYKKLGIDIQGQFQKVIENESLMPLPSILARATIYYNTWAFKNHAHIQTGITSSYYSKFEAREFFPVINEFMLTEHDREIGNYPKTDIFFNMKVDRMRIYLRGQNINSFFQRGEYFASPNQPARDFKIQLGIHWFLFS